MGNIVVWLSEFAIMKVIYCAYKFLKEILHPPRTTKKHRASLFQSPKNKYKTATFNIA
jgi:hypothetical protein